MVPRELKILTLFLLILMVPPLAFAEDPTSAMIHPLIEKLQGPNPGIQRAAAFALGRIGPAAEAAVPALTQALQDADGGVRLNAIRALGKIGRAAKAAIPDLINAHHAAKGYTQEIVSEALDKISPDWRNQLKE